MKRLGLFLLAVLMVGGIGCSSDDSPYTGKMIDGNWSGTVDDSNCANGTARVTFTQSGESLGGTWQLDFNDDDCNNSGSLTGTIKGDIVTLDLAPSRYNGCHYNVTATVDGDTQIVGTYAAYSCTVESGGSFDLTR